MPVITGEYNLRTSRREPALPLLPPPAPPSPAFTRFGPKAVSPAGQPVASGQPVSPAYSASQPPAVKGVFRVLAPAVILRELRRQRRFRPPSSAEIYAFFFSSLFFAVFFARMKIFSLMLSRC